MIKKKNIGWQINNKYFKLNSKQVSLFFYYLDKLGNIFYFFKKRKINYKVKNILVIRLEHIGDMILTSNFVYQLKQIYPKAKITILCRKQTKIVAEMIDGVDNIITLNVPWSARDKTISYFSLLKFALKNYKKYDLAFDLFFDFRNILLGKFLSKFICGFGVRGFGFLLNSEPSWDTKDKHIVSRQLDLIRNLGFNLKEKNISLKIDKKYLSVFKDKMKKLNFIDKEYSVIQMSAGSVARELPMKFWVDLIKKDIDKKIFVCPDIDKKKVEYLKSKIKHKNLIFLSLGLKEYFYLVYLSAEMISVDTFAVHIANSFNKKIIGYYSGTNLVEEWGPYLGKNIKVFQDKKCKYYPCGFTECPFGKTSVCMIYKN